MTVFKVRFPINNNINFHLFFIQRLQKTLAQEYCDNFVDIFWPPSTYIIWERAPQKERKSYGFGMTWVNAHFYMKFNLIVVVYCFLMFLLALSLFFPLPFLYVLSHGSKHACADDVKEVRRGCLSPWCAGILTQSFYSSDSNIWMTAFVFAFVNAFVCVHWKNCVGCAVFKMAFHLLAHRLGKLRCVAGFDSVCCRELFWVLNKQPACNH